MGNFQKLQRRELLKWALAAGVSSQLINQGKSWSQNFVKVGRKADLILYNGKIATQDEKLAFAEAVAIQDNRCQLADLAVLSEDYFSVPEEKIKH